MFWAFQEQGRQTDQFRCRPLLMPGNHATLSGPLDIDGLGGRVEQTGEYRIRAGLDVVWQGLNDPEILARCIDGCLAMEKVREDRFDTTVKARFGPVSATFQAVLELSDVSAPTEYTINANVKGGAAGFARGSAKVELARDEDDAGATVLRYAVKANVGGKLAQVGSRLIDGATRKIADDFFSSFGKEVSGEAPLATTNTETVEQYESSDQWKVWLIVFAALALGLIFAF
jgi:carbon monoxide dehydrogenase subunit G